MQGFALRISAPPSSYHTNTPNRQRAIISYNSAIISYSRKWV